MIAATVRQTRHRFCLRGTGLFVLDLNSWRVRLLERRADGLHVEAGRILSDGSPAGCQFLDGAAIGAWRGIGAGISAYDAHGHRLYHLFDGRAMQIDRIVRGRAFAGPFFVGTAPTTPWTVFDVRTGRILGRVRRIHVLLLSG